ncbi:hypothetical protein P8H26_01895 [Pseudochrobactrum sp. sp1633]|uniref:hypothetical protein n=1 Tax=Pseudochrobactrum sp. sp1633 TaxID=3036706 RepID=UPI0025A593D8|nr:hypothetical protein [Pseudochrobactrum sp. sp1633]MDM8344141.1 hypothetical protein [Pseudochrobactrum sp. sp1633]HWD12115.1 hypothetical protein [Pseudochrobactrum sp.]
MAKSSFLMRQLFQNRAAKPAKNMLVSDAKKEGCPKLTSLVLILVLAMLGGVFLVKALV